ncbi:MAG: hypothetical protein Q7W05_10130 [Deltaproteobacteria bacterium]|nr:hypothetical protein [Deltaproteobacteria bacterium]
MRYLVAFALTLFLAQPIFAAPETRGLAVVAKDPNTGQPTGEVKLYNKSLGCFYRY